jgi:hypothetical protein
MRLLLLFVFNICSIFLFSQMNGFVEGSAIHKSRTVTICAGKLFQINSNSYNMTGTYTDIIKSLNGVDTILTTHLFVKPIININTSIDTNTITVIEENANYQWIDCNNDKLPIAANNRSYTAQANGGYAVIVKLNGCTDTSRCVVLDYFKLKNGIENSSSFSVVPPISAGIYMVNALKKMNSIVVVDVLGRVVHKNNPTELRTMIAIKDEPKGTYFLCIASDGKQEIFKVEKE